MVGNVVSLFSFPYQLEFRFRTILNSIFVHFFNFDYPLGKLIFKIIGFNLHFCAMLQKEHGFFTIREIIGLLPGYYVFGEVDVFCGSGKEQWGSK